jgi:hypothetical protein
METNQKTASTPIPLSPEEAQLASKLFGRSLFSALALAKEQEARRNLNPEQLGLEDERTLRIPIPTDLMPRKTAAFGQPAYIGPDTPPEPTEGQGVLAHIKRNLGKYLGSYGGAAIGGALGHAGGRGTALKSLMRTLAGGTGGAAVGAGAGALYDELEKEKQMNMMQNSAANKQRLLQSMLQTGELEQLLNSGDVKYASENTEEAYEPGMLARAFKSQSNPISMLFGSQTGFRDAKKDYYLAERKRIQDDLLNAQQEYMHVLSKIKTGASVETPCVDAFCNGIAHSSMFQKNAEDVDIEEGAVKRMLGDMLGGIKKPLQPAVDAATSGLMGTGAGSAWLTFLLRKKMREEPEKYMEQHMPTRVELEPY